MILFYIYVAMVFINIFIWYLTAEKIDKDTLKWFLLMLFVQPVTIIMYSREIIIVYLERKRGELV